MFQRICIKFDQDGSPTDLGLIAESLLFYEQVIIIGKPNILPPLLNSVDFDILIDLLLDKKLRICILKSQLAVTAQNSFMGPIPENLFQIESAAPPTIEEQLFIEFYKTNNRRGYSKRIIDHLLAYIEFITYTGNINKLVKEDLYDELYTKQVAIEVIKLNVPEFELNPNQFAFKFRENNIDINKITGHQDRELIKDMGNPFLLETSIDFREINKLIANNPKGDKFNPVSIVTNIQTTRGDLHLASRFDAEILSNSFHTSLMRLKFKRIYDAITTNRDNIYQFNDFALSDGYAIREAINNGTKSFQDFIILLKKADKFKGWLQEVKEDNNLIKEYHEAVTRNTWADKLPNKILRWSLFTGAGIALDAAMTGGIATLAALGLGVGDTFLLDLIIKGWRPSVFIENKLKNFIKK